MDPPDFVPQNGGTNRWGQCRPWKATTGSGEKTSMQDCPCGSGRAYGDCCGRYLEAGELPETPEALMRSRYTAHVRGAAPYLAESWHPSTRPASRELSDPADLRWEGLEIISAGGGPEFGEVEFIAHFHGPAGPGRVRERSRFVYEQGRWWYLDGVTPPLRSAGPKIGRNDPCPCGSGRKYKQCCGRGA
jgi:SEC-C motif-containing protein